MFLNFHFRPAFLIGALLLFAAPVAHAERRGGHGHQGGGRGGYYAGPSRGHNGGPSRNYYAGPSRGHYNGGFRGYSSGPRYYAPPRSYRGGGYAAGRFYSGRGYFYGGSFWARPYFGVGIGIPFGYGYRTNRGCGYLDGWGYFHPAPCYVDYYSGY